jgi:hypothetical protein
MALVLADRVQETTTSTGTASVLLSGAVNGYQTFTAGVGNGNTCYYTIYDNTSFAWEVGIGTYTTSPNTLTRNTILSSSNSGSAINLAGNTAAVWVDYPSERAVYKDASGNTSLTTANIGTATVGTLTATSLTSTAASFTTITSGTWNGGIIGMTYGGTGASLLPTAGASVYSTGTNLALSAAGTSGQVLVSGGSGSPTWSSGPSLNASVIVSATLTGTTVASTVTATSLTLGSPLAITSGGTGSTSAAIVAGTAISVSGTFPNQTVNNTGVTSAVAGTAISVSGSTGAVTINNTGVTSAVAGTGVSVSGATGAVTISIGQVVGTSANVQFGSFGVGTAASGTTGEIRATNNITAYYSSDRNLKENIKPIDAALQKVEYIGGKTFSWTQDYITAHGGEDEYFLQKNDFGVIAQDVQSVFPMAVKTRTDGTLAVDYAKLVALAFQAIAELKAEVDALKGK